MSIPDQVLLNMLISILFFFREVCWAGKNQNNTDKRTVIELEHFEHHMCPYSESFWSVFYRIQSEYGEIRSIYPYSVRMRESTSQ